MLICITHRVSPGNTSPSIVSTYHPPSSGGYKLIQKAYRDAEWASTGWVHDGKPYIAHLRMAAIGGIFLKLRSVEQIITALHHDTLENFANKLSYAYLEKEYGTRVAWNVQFLAREARPETAELIALADARYADRFRHLSPDRSWLILLKLVDRLHNMKSYKAFYADSEERFNRKFKETVEVFLPLADTIGYGDTFRFFIQQWLGITVPAPRLQ